MERNFVELNYYEMLDVKPNAAALEIRGAYNAAMQIYQADSLVSYSFFSPEERKKILALLEKAYFTLINEKEREIYDNELIRLGIINVEETNPVVKGPVNIFDISRQSGTSGILKTRNAELRAKVLQNQRISEILSRQEISGSDLKTIRYELDVDLEKIHHETKIRIDYLKNIEENNIEKLPPAVFLKGFIRAYLKCLYIEPADEISARYMSGLSRK